MDPKTRARFKQEFEQPGVHKNVFAWAVRLVRRHPKCIKRWGSVPMAAEELVHEAVDRALRGTRKGYPDKVSDVALFLFHTMRGIVYDEDKLSDGDALYLDGEPHADGAHPADSPLSVIDDRARGIRNPLQELVGREDFENVADALLTAMGEDPLVEKVGAALVDGVPKASDIAKETGLSAKQVYQGKRNLHIKLFRLLGDPKEVLS